MPNPIVPEDLRSWAEIDLGALRHNICRVHERLGPGVGILSVVKANAYGHGALRAAGVLAEGTAIFGVANLREAMELAPVAGGRDIMLLSPCLPGERREAVLGGHVVTVSSAAEAAAYAAFGRVRVNFKIDTGMGRVGCDAEKAESEAAELAGLHGVEVHSVSTHLPSADEDDHFTARQLRDFVVLREALRGVFPRAKFHAVNSAGVLTNGDGGLEIARPGLILYGVSPLPAFQSVFRPVMSWKARVALVRDMPTGAGISYGRTFISTKPMRTAVVPVGYADGFPRQASGNGAGVLIRGVRCSLLGRVTMDQIIVDATGVEGVVEGDEVTLFGKDGDAEIPVSELAAQSGTISWDILTGIGRRVERFYRD
jgi:alanine racemase